MKLFLPRRRLAKLGILGMNRRNAQFLMPSNPRKLYPLVDDKTRTKELAQRAGIAVPELYGVIKTNHEIRNLDAIVEGHADFVIKPARGSGGNGILVIVGKAANGHRTAGGMLVTRDEVGHHISNILSGMYSFGGVPDKAIIEYRVKFDPIFASLSYQGVPDIRTIVYRGVPIACMLRLPTHHSSGKANLHQGAVGVGIDLLSGETLGGVWKNRSVDHHPDTGSSLAGIRIPGWDTLVELAARCYDLVKLGYLGVDLVLDQTLGPLVLELNARPGLSIQLANGRGLVGPLRKIEALESIPELASERVALARELLGEARCG
jgi:alpha-L-glutamate ligase-like protein